MSEDLGLIKALTKVALIKMLRELTVEERIDLMLDVIDQSSDRHGDDLNIAVNICGNLISAGFIATGGMAMNTADLKKHAALIKASDNPHDHFDNFMNSILRHAFRVGRTAFEANIRDENKLATYKKVRLANINDL